MTISRHHRLGADLVVVRRSGLDELRITIQSEPGDTVQTMVTRLNVFLLFEMELDAIMQKPAGRQS